MNTSVGSLPASSRAAALRRTPRRGVDTSMASNRSRNTADRSTHLNPSRTAPSRRSSSALSTALQTEWGMLQSLLASHSPNRGAQLAQLEHDVQRTLTSAAARSSSNVEEMCAAMPFLLAFAVAPIPSAHTQAAALEAMRGALHLLATEWGAAASRRYVDDVLLAEHNALQAMEVSLVVSIENIRNTASSSSSSNNNNNNTSTQMDGEESSISMHHHVTDCLMELLFDLVALSPTAAQACLGHTRMMEILVKYLAIATPLQVSFMGSIWRCMCVLPEAPNVFVQCGADAAILRYLASSLGWGGRNGESGEVVGEGTITSLCMLLRVAIHLVGCATAYDAFYEGEGVGVGWTILAQLITCQWGDLVELGCLWVTALLQRAPERSLVLVEALLIKGKVAAPLAGVLQWEQLRPYSISAALCWRWMLLVHPLIAGTALGTQPRIMIAFVEVLLTQSLSFMRRPIHLHADECRTSPTRGTNLSAEQAEVALLVVESTISLGLCYALAEASTQAAMHQQLLRHLSSETRQLLRERVGEALESVADAYFDTFPVLEVTPLPSQHNATSTNKHDDDDDENGQTIIMDSPNKWRRLLDQALRSMLAGHLPSAPNQQRLHRPSLSPTPAGAPPLILSKQQHVDANVGGGAMREKEMAPMERAELIGGSFYRRTIEVVLQLSQRYVHAYRGETSASAPQHQPQKMSASLANKAANPWAPPPKAQAHRRWVVDELRRSDVVLFAAKASQVEVEMEMVMAAVQQHVSYLSQQLQLCPTKNFQRRCLLNDLFMHVYPKMFFFVREVLRMVCSSASAVELIHTMEGGTIHSGNILTVYEALVACVGDGGEAADDDGGR